MSPLPPPRWSGGRTADRTSGHLNYYCICGYSCTTAHVLFKHIRRWSPEEPGSHARSPEPRGELRSVNDSRRDENRPAFARTTTVVNP